jgi:SAM-dependent methyltransferase
MSEEKDWFEKWFDSPYYHLLYSNRDHKEAEFFIRHLTRELELAPGARVLDMACGKGRHCIYLAKLGYDVTGTDISEQSIAAAKQHENDNLSFFLHDMRKSFRVNYFDCILNLFTSFGYFGSRNENERVVRNASASLRQNGVFVLDFMNSDLVMANLCAEDKKTAGGMEFRIKRYMKDGFIHKEICFSDKGKVHHFTERVQALGLDELKKYFEQSGLKVIHLWGDYALNEFERDRSPRLIIAGIKP